MTCPNAQKSRTFGGIVLIGLDYKGQNSTCVAFLTQPPENVSRVKRCNYPNEKLHKYRIAVKGNLMIRQLSSPVSIPGAIRHLREEYPRMIGKVVGRNLVHSSSLDIRDMRYQHCCPEEISLSFSARCQYGE
jgi:hypothetical protein